MFNGIVKCIDAGYIVNHVKYGMNGDIAFR